MHIPDGFLSMPVNAAGYAVSSIVCAVAVKRANRTLQDEQIPLLGVTSAFVFAAQMLNFPIMAGTSGHFLGAVLAALLLGPLNACLVMCVVLGIQCLVFGDGGLTALGANALNMGVVGCLGGYGVFTVLRALFPKRFSCFLVAAAIASWFSVVAAAAMCSLELAVSGTSPFHVVFTAMVGVHALIGVGEAFVTTATLSVVFAARPDLVRAWVPCTRRAAVEAPAA